MDHRISARTFLAVLLAVGACTGTTIVGASGARSADPMVFPVVGTATYTHDFGAPRPQGRHEGTDIMAPRRALAVATEAGRVRFHTTSSRAGCMLYLDGDSGTTYVYIHLNNDLTDSNDNKGSCVPGVSYAPGLRDGQHVAAGDQVGFVGDSGDANGIATHLHFEVHPGGGDPVDPYPYLARATKLLFSAPHGTAITLSLTGSVVASANGTLSLKVESAQVFPLGLRLTSLPDRLDLGLPPTATTDANQAGQTLNVTTGSIGKRVIVLTEPARPSVAIETLADGSFSVSRLALRTGTR